VPQKEYGKRLEERLKSVDAKEALHRRFGNLKLAIIVAGIVVLWLSLRNGLISVYWLAAPIAVYAILTVMHEFALRARARATTAAAFYRKGIARMEDRWAGTGATGERFRNPKHVYADDLDIFGAGCLFELLSTARLPMGEEFLARWLSAASPIEAIRERHGVAAELRDKLDLREELALVGEDLRIRLDPGSLVNWAEGKPLLHGGALRIVTALLATLAVATGAYALITLKIVPLLVVLVIEAGAFAWLQKRAVLVVSSLQCNAEGLELFSAILARLEHTQFTSTRLETFAAELKHGHGAASQALRRLARIVYWIDGRGGMLMQFLELPLLYTVQTAMAADAWRTQWGGRMRAWVDITGEIEALLSLAGYSYEHPDDPFPEIITDGEDSSALFEGDELGHPLIPAATCMRNSLRLDAATQVLLVSGSNMSGKSTFLRTAGINAVLAMAGAPIRGKSLRMTPVLLGTSIRRVDSLQENRSSFYTEILRIRDVFQLTENKERVLFLFDELLEGTNSNDRRIGADGLLRALLGRGAVGIVTTHDLALTGIADSMPGAVRNVHFQDYVEDGKMRFDHKLRDGVVAKSNALELMRLIGLKV
jgi:hypothetical protein